jgi:GNAT superfamily N-acetyltransferase
MKVRMMKDDDFEKVLDVTQEFNNQSPYSMPFNRKDASASLVNLQKTAIVAEDKGEIVGVLLLAITPVFWNYSQKQGTELCFYVHPDYRKGSLGKQLIAKMEMLGQLHGLSVVAMASISSSKDKVFERYYGRLGYKKMEITYVKEI